MPRREIWIASHIDIKQRFNYLLQAVDSCLKLNLPVYLSISLVDSSDYEPLELEAIIRSIKGINIIIQNKEYKQFEHIHLLYKSRMEAPESSRSLESLEPERSLEFSDDTCIIFLDDDDLLLPTILEETSIPGINAALSVQLQNTPPPVYGSDVRLDDYRKVIQTGVTKDAWIAYTEARDEMLRTGLSGEELCKSYPEACKYLKASAETGYRINSDFSGTFISCKLLTQFFEEKKILNNKDWQSLISYGMDCGLYYFLECNDIPYTNQPVVMKREWTDQAYWKTQLCKYYDTFVLPECRQEGMRLE
jgi:hypothetical protein